VALRLRQENQPLHPAPPALQSLCQARGWIWPSVSRRAPGRERIDLWSSWNEVAAVEQPQALADALDALSPSAPARWKGPLEPLTTWHLASMRFERKMTWTHHE
jgi:hypothetical protein